MPKIRYLLLALLFGCMTSSCINTSDTIISVPKDALPIVLRAGLEKRISQDNEFAFDLFKKTIDDSGETNIFISPLSVSIALGMTWNGANGSTKTEMEQALKMSGMSVTDMNDYYKVLQTNLPVIDPTTKLDIANSLWYKTGFPIKSDFLKVNNAYFNAEVRELDFTKAWAKDTINNCCARRTNNLIPTILDQIPYNAITYLINAVYFKGMWRKQFDKKKTVEANFTNDQGNLVKVNMMYQKDTFAYAADTYAQYLEMPYGNKAFAMTVVLPIEGKTTTDMINYLTVNNWNSIHQDMSTKVVEVYLPRFQTKSKFLLNNVLQSMGMKLAFTNLADFTNIADANLYISRVLHNTFVEVTEEGTKAAAVTAVEIGVTSVGPTINPIFKVNKPFLFVIHEKSTGVILFMGKMGNVDKF